MLEVCLGGSEYFLSFGSVVDSEIVSSVSYNFGPTIQTRDNKCSYSMDSELDSEVFGVFESIPGTFLIQSFWTSALWVLMVVCGYWQWFVLVPRYKIYLQRSGKYLLRISVILFLISFLMTIFFLL